MIEEHFRVTVNDRNIAAIRTLPDGHEYECVLVYAPGAGSNLHDPFGSYLAQHLAGAAISTVRFQFPYMEERRRRPDPARLLEACWREVIQTVRHDSGRLVVGGRSMGGRFLRYG